MTKLFHLMCMPMAVSFCICTLLSSSLVHAADIANENADMESIIPSVPLSPLPLDVIDQILQHSVRHSPQDLVNARLIGTRYQRAFPSQQRRHQVRMRLDRACGDQMELHLDEAPNPIEALNTLIELCERALGPETGDKGMGHHQGKRTLLAARDSRVIVLPGYEIGLGGINNAQLRFDMHLRSRSQTSGWTLPCPLTPDQVMDESYGYVYKILGVPRGVLPQDFILSSSIALDEEEAKMGVRVWTVVYRRMEEGRIRGVCAGMGYLEYPLDYQVPSLHQWIRDF